MMVLSFVPKLSYLLLGPSLFNPLSMSNNTIEFFSYYRRLLHSSNLLRFFFAVYSSVEPGWLQATFEGKTGLIPENYVVFL